MPPRLKQASTRVAVAHDFLGARAGGERVAMALADAFDGAPIHTLIYEPTATFQELGDHSIVPSWLNRVALFRTRYRAALPLAALAFASRRIRADVVVCSTSGLSHHVRTTGAKVVYCHTPARWLYGSDDYLDGFGGLVKTMARAVRPLYSWLDRRAMRSADQIIANSEQIRGEIAAIYGRDATVIAPASAMGPIGPQARPAGLDPAFAEGFVLSVTRPLAYKRLDLLVEAAAERSDRRFVLIGDGPNRADIERAMPTNMISLGSVPDETLRWAYANAAVVVLTCAEDFGLVPGEAAAFGKYAIAPKARALAARCDPNLIHYVDGSIAGLLAALEQADRKTALSPLSPTPLPPTPLSPTPPARGVSGSSSDTERFAEAMRAVVDGL